MVRVISCHHFVSQDVFTSEQEASALGSAQGKLLYATTQHNVEVRDLDVRGNTLHSFPTVDQVKQLLYCDIGNYIASLECKVSRHCETVSFVRIYFNWWVDVKGQAMKVRVAGCSAPSEQCDIGSFEVVELPLEQTALSIACCTKTAGLAVSLGKCISLFCFHAKTHSIWKSKFYDFDHLLNIYMNFTVKELDICETYFACLTENQIQVFRICFGKQDDEYTLPDLEKSKTGSKNFTRSNNTSGKINDINYIEWKFESYESNMEPREQLKADLHLDSFPLSVHLPAIETANQNSTPCEGCKLHGPLSTGRGHDIEVKMDPKMFEIYPSLVTMNISCHTLLYKQILTGENKYCLTGLQLIPMYQCDYLINENLDPLNAASSVSERELFSLPWSPLTSSSYPHLKSVCCFFTTSQEGFLYDVTSTVKLLCTYPYTAPLKSVVLEPTLLHALTDAGLETYTLHVGHSAIQHAEDLDQLRNASPGYEESVCLLGLRPFLGVDELVICENYIVLVSSADDSLSNSGSLESSGCTLYSLKRPSPEQLYADLLEVGQFHKKSSPPTYLHLLSEAHMILRTYLFISKSNHQHLTELYQKSCTLMADYFLRSDLSAEKHLAVPYYLMGKLPVEAVLQRILEFHHQGKHSGILKILVHYLNLVLLKNESCSPLPLPQATAEAILDVYAEEAPELLWKVILLSGLQGYRIEKAILILKRKITCKHSHSTPIGNAADTVAIVVLLLQKGNYEAAQNMILSIPKAELLQILSDICELMWTDDHLSTFGKFMKQVRPDIFLELFLLLTFKGRLQVYDVTQFLQKESCTAEIHMVPLLKEYLETFISGKKFCAENISACIILLADIYLNRLKDLKKISSVKSYATVFNAYKSASLFGSRAPWLDEMSPFNGKGIFKTCVSNTLKSENEHDAYCCCWACNEDLLRLQSLLTWQRSTTSVTEHVLDFLESLKTTVRGHCSLEVLCCSDESQALSMLLETCPAAVLLYANSTFRTNSENWYLLFSLITGRMEECSSDNQIFRSYEQILTGALNHISEILDPPALISLIQNCKHLKLICTSHIKRCCEKQQAEQLKNKIVSLGKEIKDMM